MTVTNAMTGTAVHAVSAEELVITVMIGMVASVPFVEKEETKSTLGFIVFALNVEQNYPLTMTSINGMDANAKYVEQ